MSSKRSIALFFIILLCSWAVFAGSGYLEVKTEHFTIIYDEQCWKTASVLVKSCEDEYSYLCTLFGTDPKLHIPVVITSQYKVLNAYYTSFPSNRIVLFDTVASNGSLSNFPNTIVYVFRHELSHAFTMNIRSDFWQFISNIFGDGVSVSPLLYAYPSMVEGIAVLSESLDGYGRLNNLYSTSIVRQAKIEGLFPSWTEIAGSMDIYPSSSLPYIFGGAFLSYLCDEYGIDKVYEAFVNFGKVNWFKNTAKIIESSIGVSFKELWQGFYDSIDVPSTFVESSSLKDISLEGSISNLTLSPSGDVYFIDSASYSLYKIDETNSKGFVKVSSVSPYIHNGSGIDVSIFSRLNCELILVPVITQSCSYVEVLDVNSGKTLCSYSFDNRDVRGGCFIETSSFNGVLLYTVHGQETFLELFEIFEDYSLSQEPVSSLSLGYGTIVSDLTTLDSSSSDMKVAFILTTSGCDNLAVLSIDIFMSLDILDNPSALKFKSLSKGVSEEGETVFSFSWFPASTEDSNISTNDISANDISANSNNVPYMGGYGEFLPNTWEIRLSYANIVGGINSPLRLGNTIIFSSSMFKGDLIRQVSLDSLSMGEYEEFHHTTFKEPDLKISSDFIGESSKYSPLSNLSRGVLFPFGVYGPLSSVNDVGLGLTWYSSDPTSTVTTTVSGLYSQHNPSLYADFVWSDFINIGFSLGAKLLWDKEANKFSSYGVAFLGSISKSFEFGVNNALSFSDSISTAKIISFEGSSVSLVSNVFQVSFSHTISTGLSYYDTFGYGVGLKLAGINPTLLGIVVFPKILPLKNAGGFTYNLPLRLDAAMSYYVFEKELLCEGSAKATVLSYEIQRGIQFLGLYFRRASLDVTYNVNYAVSSKAFAHNLEASLLLYLSPVVGLYATKLNIGVGAKLTWNFKSSPAVEFSMTIN